MADPPLLELESASMDEQFDLVLQLQPSTVPIYSSYTLIAKFMGEKILNHGVVHAMLQKIWNFGGLVVISHVGLNTYSITIDSQPCYRKISG